VHRVVAAAPIRAGDVVTAQVAAEARSATMRNHTATHLLHAALRQILGSHVKQAGSVVEPGRLRFDFTHYTAMDAEEIAEVEHRINEEILANKEVGTDLLELEDALATGAMALFGEKYADRVRVVSVQDCSKELCGGTHVARTGDIGLCKIIAEGSISAGVRRIEAITGVGALDRFQEASASLERLAEMMKVSEPELLAQVEKVIAQQKALEKQLDQMKAEIARAHLVEIQPREIKGAKVVAVEVSNFDRQQLREAADWLRAKFGDGVYVLGTNTADGPALVAAVSKGLTSKVHAGKLAGEVAQAVGGKGGGRPDMAEGGGKNPDALAAAVESVYRKVEDLL